MIKIDFKLIVLGLTVISALYLWRRSQHAPQPLVKSATPITTAVAISQKPAPAEITNDKAVLSPSSAQKTTSSPLLEIEKIKPHLNRFSQLQVKVLRNVSEENELLVILRNPTILGWAEKILNHPDSRYSQEKNKALSMVLQSMQSGEPVAEKVLSSLIANADIENESQPLQDRKFQAELKAEAMFTWSSQKPSQVSHIESLLPGPLSQKIWQNVLAQQNNNLEESALTL